MSFRRTLLFTASALALAACQHQDEVLTPLPPLSDAAAGGAGPRVSGRVGIDSRALPAPEISPGTTAPASNARLPAGGATGDVQLNFADTDIREIVRQVLGTILQVNYSIDPAVHGTATIETSKPLKREELLPTLELLLNQNGASLVQSGSLYRVLPSSSAVTTPSLAEAQTTGSESVTLRYASAKDLAKVLEPFVGEGARVTADPNRNVLLISGEPAARRTIESLIQTFDIDILAGQSFAIFPVGDNDPGKIATELQKALLTEGDSALSGVLRVIPMDRANAVLVISSQRRYIASAERLFHLIEKTRKDTERSWHVYYIQNGQANDVANVLQRAFTPNNVTAKPDASPNLTSPGQGQSAIGGSGVGGSSGFGGSSSIGGSSTGSSSSSALGTPSLLGGGSSGSGTSSGSSAFGSPSSSSSSGGDNSASTESLSSSSQSGGSQQNNAMRIIPNKQNNALLIFATPEEESSVESMLHKIDIIPLQVRIDATIAEVDLNDQLQYGTQFYFRNLGLSSGGVTNTVTTPASGSTPASTTTIPSTLNLSNLFAGGTAVGSGFPGGLLAKTDSDVQYALAALQAVTNLRVLSAPQLVVLDNQPAKLLVGDSVPYQNGSLSTASGSTSGITAETSISYQQTGVIMQILPHVNSGGLVTLDIAQEVSDVVPGTGGTTTPTFSDRQVTTRVAVQDGQTVGIAGLITDQSSEGNEGLPYLKDIPVIGNLFGQQTNTRGRKELLVMITPHVIRDQRDARQLTQDLREKLPHAGLVPQELQVLPFSGSSNPNGDLTR